MKQLFDKYNQIAQFIQHGLWKTKLKEQPFWRRLGLKSLRILLIAIRGFNENQCQLRASSLTYFSLLSIVPVVAMAFGIAKGFGLEASLEREIGNLFSGQEEVAARVLEFARALLSNTKGGLVAGIGFVVLLYTVMRLLNYIEDAFNAVWEVKLNRSFLRKFTDYLTIMLIAPILVILSGSLTVFVATNVQEFSENSALVPIELNLLQFSAFFISWLLFTLIYIVMPNIRVHWQAGLIAGILAGTFYQAFERLYVFFQVEVSNYNAIYGSFAALPLFLIWLQLSWTIILFGAEISYAIQNVYKYEFEGDTKHLNIFQSQLVSLAIMHLVIKRFREGQPSALVSDISQELQIPVNLTGKLLRELQESGLLVQVFGNHDREPAFLPARDIHQLSISDILKAIEQRGVNQLDLKETTAINKIRECLLSIREKQAKLPDNELLMNL